jgi:ribosomal protein S18 acetylase RimI-like enzyme
MIDESILDPDSRQRRALLDALALAFRDNPMNLAIHGPPSKKRVWANRAGLRALVLDTRKAAIARVLRFEDRVVGGFILVPPDAFPLSGPSISRQIGCIFRQGVRAMDRWGAVTHSLGVVHPSERHWYLSVLGIVPWAQGHGFGRRLLDEIDRIIEADPCGIYLESDREESMRFYLAHGFHVRDEMTLEGVRCWCLGKGFGGTGPDLCDSVRELEAV